MGDSTRAGRDIRILTGYWALVLAPLPPKIHWETGLISILAEAERALATPAARAGDFPFPRLLRQPFIRPEAVLSSSR
jgi:hypothetical protein